MFQKYRVEYSDQFWDDLIGTAEYIASEYSNRYYADVLTDRVFISINKVAERGKFSRSAKYTVADGVDYYRILVDKYTIVYKLIDDTMYIHRLIHSSRDIFNLL